MIIEHYDDPKFWPRLLAPSLHYLECKADGALVRGFVVPTCDYACKKTDAARHVAGLKQGVIVLPETWQGRRQWYFDFCFERRRRINDPEFQNRLIQDRINRGEFDGEFVDGRWIFRFSRKPHEEPDDV